MDVKTLQGLIVSAGQPITVDGQFGPRSRAALREVLSGPTDPVGSADIERQAAAYGLTPELVGTVYDVESKGRGMSVATGLPVILYEPHIFSRLTQRRFDGSHPDISYPKWKTRPYPSTQTGRYDQMMSACALAPAEAMKSASWGLGQVMGFNHAACGFDTVWDFVLAMAKGEGAQLGAMLAFIKANGLIPALLRKDWRAFAKGYNGAGQVDLYARLLSEAYAKRSGR